MTTKTLEQGVQERLRAYVEKRLKADTQTGLAKRLGVTQSYISSFRSGTTGGGGKLLRGIADEDPAGFVLILGNSGNAGASDSDNGRSNRDQAIALLVEHGSPSDVAEEAVKRAAVALDAEELPSVIDWLDMARPFMRSAGRDRVEKTGTSKTESGVKRKDTSLAGRTGKSFRKKA